MISLLYCLLAPSAPPEEALDRYVALRRRAPAVEMAFHSGPVKGNLTIHPGKQMRFEAKEAGLDYLCTITPKGMRELDRLDRMYDELPFTTPSAPPSRMKNVGSLFPRWVLLDDFRKMFPAQAKFTGLGPRIVNGVSGDAIRGFYEDKAQQSTNTVEAVIDATGTPRYVLVHGEAPMGGYRMEWTIDRFRAIPAPPASLFAFQIPDGYTPFSLDLVPGPAGVGTKLPLTGWRTPSGGALNLGSRLAKGGLVAILGADSEPSRRATAALGKIRAAGIPIVTLSDATDAKSARGTDGYDPTGKLLDALAIPATPTFYRVDPKGNVTAVWMGFDPAKADEFVREVKG